MFCKKGVLRNFAKFTGKHLCQILFFNKVAGLRPATLLKKSLRPPTLLKKSLWYSCFPVNFAKFLRTPLFTELLRWLLLSFHFQLPVKALMKFYLSSLNHNIPFPSINKFITFIMKFTSYNTCFYNGGNHID